MLDGGDSVADCFKDHKLLSAGDWLLYREEAVVDVESLQQQTGSIRVIVFSTDGKYMLSGGDDKTLRIWTTDDWTLLATV